MDDEELRRRIMRLELREEQVWTQQQLINAKLDALNSRFDKYEGKWGGIVMVVGAIAALLVAFRNEITRWFA